MTSGKGTDLGPKLVVDAVSREALQQAPFGREHANRSVMSPDQLGSRLDGVPEDAVEGHVRDQGGRGDD
jgi:hypothetical protein